MYDQSGATIPLSVDHKPNHPKEKERIEAAGGHISFFGVWRVAGILATSRAIGDLPLKQRNFLVAEADIVEIDIEKEKPKFLIIATDGLWDVFSNEEATQFIQESLNEPFMGSKGIVLQAYHRGSMDNITVMVIRIR